MPITAGIWVTVGLMVLSVVLLMSLMASLYRKAGKASAHSYELHKIVGIRQPTLTTAKPDGHAYVASSSIDGKNQGAMERFPGSRRSRPLIAARTFSPSASGMDHCRIPVQCSTTSMGC